MRSALPMPSRIGRTRLNALSSPPTMIDSVPLIAPISPPLTGASRSVAPFSAAAAAKRLIAIGDMLLMSMITAPRWTAGSIPSAPVRTASTSAVSGSIVITTVDCRATSAGEPAAVAPAAATSSVAPRLRLCTTSVCPALIRFFAMGLPMTPSPTNPIVSATFASSFMRDGAPIPATCHGSLLGSPRYDSPFNRRRIILARFHMKRALVLATLIGFAAAPLVAGGKGTVSGAYVEARTAEVFTGGCIMGSEAETVGKQAVLAWKVDRGTFNGVSLDGLSVVAALSGDRNLGIQEIGGGKPDVRSALFVDNRANPAQQFALVAMVNELSSGLVGTIVQVTP